MKKIIIPIIILILIVMCIVGCLVFIKDKSKIENNVQNEISNNVVNEDMIDENRIKLSVNGKDLIIDLENNSSSKAFLEKLKQGDLEVEANDYSNFEKVGSLGFDLPTNDEVITTEVGDVILYQGNQIAIYYDTNTWDFTKLGKINEISQDELKNILGNENVTLKFSLLNKEENTDNTSNVSRVAVIYFSATGNTEKIAKYIKSETNGEIQEIVPKDKYTSEDLAYHNDCRVNREQQDENARPEIENNIDVSKYDTIFLGYPIWWGDVPKIILTFIDNNNLDGKTVIPFCTSGGTEILQSQSTLKSYNKNINWIEGKRFSSSASQDEISSWISGLNY